ncbi:MAG: response regulator transcription factor [Chloroflexi bacterium]|nr:response regulator transcription factor [Chloroflexota bacterium]
MTNQNNTQTNPEIRLLIVDDEPNIRSALGLALRLLGYSVDEASSGEEALSLLGRLPYNLMVLDMRMPGLDGVEVMRRARQLRPDLLIVILTGHATLDSAIAAVKSEAVDYLLKPSSVHEIAETVTRALQKQTGQRQRQQLMQLMGEALEALRHTETSHPAAATAHGMAESVLQFHPLTLDRQKRMLMIAGDEIRTIHLTEGETIVMASLMMYPDQILSCHDLIRVGWGHDMNEREAQGVIRPHVCRLRGKISMFMTEPAPIHTVRKRGYLFSINKR